MSTMLDGCCPACGDPIDYCQGHGTIGDPAGAAILAAHDDGDHDGCHPKGCGVVVYQGRGTLDRLDMDILAFYNAVLVVVARDVLAECDKAGIDSPAVANLRTALSGWDVP